MPLADGYATTFRNFDVKKQKLETEAAEGSSASESVTVPAGTFDAYKVEITSADNEADKQTIWIAKDSRKVVKISADLVNLGGAMLTSELTQ